MLPSPRTQNASPRASHPSPRAARPTLVLLALIALYLAPLRGFSQIKVNGVADRTVYVDLATFTIPQELGFLYSATLNGVPIPTQQPIHCGVDYYDLLVQRTDESSGAQSQSLIRFIVRSSERKLSEVGLRAWTPLPIVQSASDEFAGAQMHLVVPKSMPAGLPIPSVVTLTDDSGSPIRLNGLCALLTPGASLPGFQLRRGIGSAVSQLTASDPNPSQITARLPGLEVSKNIQIESNPVWTPIGGTLTGTPTFPEGSRIQVNQTLTIPTGTTLTIGKGSILAMAKDVDIEVRGTLKMEGTTDDPIVVLPQKASEPWGGMMFRTATTTGLLQRTFFTGSGANPIWFNQNTGYSVHRKEQALVLAENGAQVELDQCWLIDNHGQAGHGKNAFVTYRNTLIQRCITAGEYAGGSAKLLGASLLEFPVDNDTFADDDNDAIYFTSGDHHLIDTLIGWAKDDGMDAGSGGFGTMTVSNCWVESAYHEAMAWSGDSGRNITVRNSIVMNSGQGIECGFGKPIVDASGLLSIGNLSGARFGDNYDWTYLGFLRVTNSILLNNYKDIWGQTWAPNTWTNELDQMDLRGNYITRANPLYPGNTVWNPSTDADKLRPFLRSPENRNVGAAIQIRTPQLHFATLTNGIPVGLSRFHTQPVSIQYRFSQFHGTTLLDGELVFQPGEITHKIALPLSLANPDQPVLFEISAVNHTEITGISRAFYTPSAPTPAPINLVSRGSRWTYWDQGSEPTGTWKTNSYTESGWSNGLARLGFGNDGEITKLASGPTGNRFMAYYFRHTWELPSNLPELDKLTLRFLRDDGGIVSINGLEAFRSNMPEGTIAYSTPSIEGTTSESEFFLKDISPSFLRTGSNLVAVEVHQSGPTSGDLGFDLELIAIPTSPAPQLYWGTIHGETFLAWSDSRFSLESSTLIEGPWQSLTSPQSFIALSPSTTPGTRFFRLKLSP